MPANNQLFLSNQLNEIESLIPQHKLLTPSVSKVSVGWHLDHMLKVINGIYMTLNQSDPTEYKPDFNIRRKLIFTIGIIPRGQGKTPKSVKPPDLILTEDVHYQLDEASKHLLAFDSLNENQFFKHYVFGMLNRKKAKRFVEIHTNHHLKIARDIIKQQ